MTYVGTGFPLLLKASYRQTRDGIIVENHFKVPTNLSNAFLAQLQSDGFTEIAVDPQQNTPFDIFTVVTTANTNPTTILSDRWGIAYNEEQISIWDKPEVRIEMRKTSAENAAQFRADTEAVLEGRRTVEDESGASTPISFDILLARAASFGMDTAVITSLFRSLGDNVESYIESLPVLRRSITVNSNTSLTPAMSNIGTIYSTTSLLAAQPTVPNNLANGLPSTGYWIKKAPTAEQLEDGRWAYTEEYWYVKQYDPFIYTNVIP